MYSTFVDWKYGHLRYREKKNAELDYVALGYRTAELDYVALAYRRFEKTAFLTKKRDFRKGPPFDFFPIFFWKKTLLCQI